MGRQINYYLLDQDHDVIREILDAVGPYLLVCDGQRLQQTSFDAVTKAGARGYLMRPTDEHLLQVRQHSDRSWIEIVSSPCIEYRASFRKPGRIGRGRLYLTADYYDEVGLVRKDAAFLKWAESIFRRLRRRLKDKAPDGWSRIGPRALAAYRSNESALFDGIRETRCPDAERE